MVLPETITGYAQFLKVVILPDGNFQTVHYVLRKGKCVRMPEKVAGKQALSFVLLEGEGVLQRVYREGDESIRRITENPDLLYDLEQREGETVLRFMRRDKADEVVAGLEQRGRQVYGVYLSGGKEGSLSLPEDDEVVRWLRIRKEEMRFRVLFRPDRKGKVLGECVFRRLRLPLLCFWLIVLVGNFFGTVALEERVREQEAIVAVRMREREGRNREDEGIRNLSEKVRRWSVRRCALLLDRIARHVPGEMQLSLLSVAPFEGKLQAGRDPEVASGVVLIGGETSEPGTITRFCRLLEKEAFGREIELKTIHRLSGREAYRFEIKVSL